LIEGKRLRLSNCRHPRRRVTQYSRDGGGKTGRPRRTGCPAFEGDEEMWHWRSVRNHLTPPPRRPGCATGSGNVGAGRGPAS
jgi:hypothetical protein